MYNIDPVNGWVEAFLMWGGWGYGWIQGLFIDGWIGYRNGWTRYSNGKVV